MELTWQAVADVVVASISNQVEICGRGFWGWDRFPRQI
uniref:Uncharacterized protein n=1 Tax=Arundo donax TaxID=35708 RepID=A0A0A9AIY0_ARUDO